MMPFEMREKFAEVGFHDFSTCTELTTDFRRDLCFGATLLQEFEHAGTDKVQPEHLSVEDVEDDGSVLVVGRTKLCG